MKARIMINFQQYISDRLYPLGYEFTLKQGKQSAKACEVINYKITHDAHGNVLSFEYVIAYEFMGQQMRKDVRQTTIDRATNNGWKELTK